MSTRILLVIVCLSPSAGLSAAPYLLGPGDVIAIKIINFDNLSTQAKVQPDGRISLPLVGNVEAAGKTAEKLAEELTTKYSEFVVRPSVWVTISEFRQDTVLILGLIGKPGPSVIGQDTTIVTAIASAGGTLEKADTANILVTRNNQETIHVNLDAAATDPKQNIKVVPGDIIFVPESKDRVLVAGSVTNPGSYDLKPGMRVLDALSAAGGLTTEANAAGALLTSASGTQARVNLDGLLKKGEAAENVEIRAGDVLLVPRQDKRFFVFGQVGKSGGYPLTGEERLLDALSAAGGTGTASNLSNISVVRMVDGKATALSVNLNDFAKKGDQAQNIKIEPSDIVFVPEKGEKKPFQILDALRIVSDVFFLADRF